MLYIVLWVNMYIINAVNISKSVFCMWCDKYEGFYKAYNSYSSEQGTFEPKFENFCTKGEISGIMQKYIVKYNTF